jgi:hypothetical protein
VTRPAHDENLGLTLRDAIAWHLPGIVEAERSLQLPTFSGRLGGVDVAFDPHPRLARPGLSRS